jgi:hypothetical protein
MAEHHAKDRRGAELRTNVVNTPAAHFQRAFHQEGGRKGEQVTIPRLDNSRTIKVAKCAE